jgi:SNW domain-containing protein 1
VLWCCLQEREERRRRDELREERRRERERERRLEAKDGHGPAKKSKLTRDRERDVGEKIALGMANVGATGEVAYDSRLFNQEQGMGTGFGAEDSYNLYDKPLFTTRESNLFKPVKNRDEEVYAGAAGGDGDIRTEKFKADRGFSGAERDGAAAAGGAKRGAGVEYEHAAVEADPFGLEQFMQNVDKGRRPLDGIGQKGGMAAGAGGGGYDGEGSGRRMQFTSGSQR